jgi:hypothetical protein
VNVCAGQAVAPQPGQTRLHVTMAQQGNRFFLVIDN